RNQLYPYYRFSSTSAHKDKSMNAETVHGRLRQIFEGIVLSPKQKETFKVILLNKYEQLETQTQRQGQEQQAKLLQLEKEHSGLINKLLQVSNSTVIQKIEAELEKIELRIAAQREAMLSPSTQQPLGTEILKMVTELILNPQMAWDAANVSQKQQFLQLWFKSSLKVKP
ncbi:hypothetical protein SAMN05421780_1209, partial [Flexibacter flexilis DSM 6793]